MKTPVATFKGLGRNQTDVIQVRFFDSDDPFALASVKLTGKTLEIFDIETFWAVLSSAVDIVGDWDPSDGTDRQEIEATRSLWRRFRKLDIVGDETTIYNFSPAN